MLHRPRERSGTKNRAGVMEEIRIETPSNALETWKVHKKRIFISASPPPMPAPVPYSLLTGAGLFMSGFAEASYVETTRNDTKIKQKQHAENRMKN